MINKLPLWSDIESKITKGEKINPIELFIYDNEPAENAMAKSFRMQLSDVIEYSNSIVVNDYKKEWRNLRIAKREVFRLRMLLEKQHNPGMGEVVEDSVQEH